MARPRRRLRLHHLVAGGRVEQPRRGTRGDGRACEQQKAGTEGGGDGGSPHSRHSTPPIAPRATTSRYYCFAGERASERQPSRRAERTTSACAGRGSAHARLRRAMRKRSPRRASNLVLVPDQPDAHMQPKASVPQLGRPRCGGYRPFQKTRGGSGKHLRVGLLG